MNEFIQIDLRTILAEYTISGRVLEETCGIPRYKIERYKKEGAIAKQDYNKLISSFPLVFTANAS